MLMWFTFLLGCETRLKQTAQNNINEMSKHVSIITTNFLSSLQIYIQVVRLICLTYAP